MKQTGTLARLSSPRSVTVGNRLRNPSRHAARRSLVHPPKLGFQVSALTLEAHGGHDTPRLPRLDDAHDLVRLCGGKVRFHELVAPLLGVLQQRTLAVLDLFPHPDRKSTRLNSSHRCISY